MTTYQKMMLFIFTTLTFALIIMEAYGIRDNLLLACKYATMLLLVLTVYVGKGQSIEQRNLFWTFPLMITGDFFLVFSYVIEDFPENIRYLGFLPFIVAYIIMIKVYIKDFKWNKRLILPSIFYLGLAIILNKVLKQYTTSAEIFAGGVVITAVTFMAWSAVTAIWNGYYKKRIAKLMAFSGFLMVLCDYGVGLDLFYPGIFAVREVLVVNLVWLAYLPGWLILAYLVVDKNLRVPKSN